MVPFRKLFLMSFLKTLTTVNITSGTKKGVGTHEIKKKYLMVTIRTKQHQYYNFLYFYVEVFLGWFCFGVCFGFFF